VWVGKLVLLAIDYHQDSMARDGVRPEVLAVLQNDDLVVVDDPEFLARVFPCTVTLVVMVVVFDLETEDVIERNIRPLFDGSPRLLLLVERVPYLVDEYVDWLFVIVLCHFRFSLLREIRLQRKDCSL
jgi:hypothetical protein